MLGALVLFSMCKKDKGDPAGGNGNNNSPRLVSFSPESGIMGDTVIINGVNFPGIPTNVQVSFGNTPAKVLNVNTATINNTQKIAIMVLVPDMTDVTTKINVKVDSLQLTTEKSFTRTPFVTVFSGFSPANGYIGDTITLTGTFNKNTHVVSFGDIATKIISQDSKTLQVVVPDDINNATPAINVVADGKTLTSATPFHLNAPLITSVSPAKVFLGQAVIITGKGFRNSTDKQVYVDNTPLLASALNHNLMPFDLVNVGLGMHGVAVEVAGLKTLAKDSVRLIAPEITAVYAQDSVTEGDLLDIKGHNFVADGNYMTVVTAVDNNGRSINLNVLTPSLKEDEILATIPKLPAAGKYMVTVTIASSSVTYNTPFIYKMP
jgi:hypothetical protein